MQKSEKKVSATNLLNELAKLRTQQKYLETTQAQLKPISQTQSEYAELNDIECLKIEQNLNLVAFADKIKYDTLHIRDTIDAFRTEMLHETGLHQFHTKQYREQIELIDQQLRDMDTMNCEQVKRLKLEYCDIESELLPLMANLDFMEKLIVPSAIGRKASTDVALSMRRVHSAPIDRTDLDDIRQFDRFVVEHHGHSGGWNSEEHALFVKMRNKCKTNIEEMCLGLAVFYIGKAPGTQNLSRNNEKLKARKCSN